MNIDQILDDLGLEKYIKVFQEHNIDIAIASELTNDDYKELGVSIGDRKRISKALIQHCEKHGTKKHQASAERRQLSIIMCDLVDSTSLANNLDPEDYRKIIISLRQVCEESVNKYEGIITQYEGDGLLAYFGYPIAHKNDSDRAVSTGLEVIRKVSSMDEVSGQQLEIRVGIATGEVVVELTTGKLAVQQGGTHGGPPILSKRLQGLALPGQLYICDVTKSLLARHWEVIQIGKREVKGISNPIKVWQVKKGKHTSTKRKIDHNNLFVGRQHELESVDLAWRNSKSNEGASILIEGEPGVGKTKLIKEFLQKITLEDKLIFKFYCSRRHKLNAFHPIKQSLLTAILNSKENIDSPLTFNDVNDFLETLDVSFLQLSVYIAQLLNIGLPENIIDISVSKEEHKELTIEALIKIIHRLATNTPIIMLIEDLHWVDPTTDEFLARLIEKSNKKALLILGSRRITELGRVNSEPLFHKILLKKLNVDETNELIESLSLNKELPSSLIDIIRERTDGLPLYIEEFTKYAITMNAEDKHPKKLNRIMPSALQGSLLGRLDRVSELVADVKPVAQVCSVLAENITINLLEKLFPNIEIDLDVALNSLVNSGILKKHVRRAHEYYVFHHDLLKEAIYLSLLRSEQRRIHSDIADMYQDEELDLTRLPPSLIANHYTSAERYHDAITWWHKAAQSAVDTASNIEAAICCENAITLFYQLDLDPSQKKWKFTFLLKAGDIFRAAYGTSSPKALKCYEQAKLLSESDIYVGPIMNCHCIYGQFAANFSSADYKTARILATKIIDYGRLSESNDVLDVGYQALGITEFVTGNFENAKQGLLQSLNSNAKSNIESQEMSFSQYPYTARSYLAWSLFILGEQDQAIKECKNAIAVIDNATPFQQALTIANACYLFLWMNDVNQVDYYSRKLSRLATQQGLPVWNEVASFYLSWSSSHLNLSVSDLNIMEKFVDHTELHELPYYQTVVAERFLEHGSIDSAYSLIFEAINNSNGTGETWYLAESYRILATLELRRNHSVEDYMEIITNALKLAKQQNAHSWIKKIQNDYRGLIEKNEISTKNIDDWNMLEAIHVDGNNTIN